LASLAAVAACAGAAFGLRRTLWNESEEPPRELGNPSAPLPPRRKLPVVRQALLKLHPPSAIAKATVSLISQDLEIIDRDAAAGVLRVALPGMRGNQTLFIRHPDFPVAVVVVASAAIQFDPQASTAVRLTHEGSARWRLIPEGNSAQLEYAEAGFDGWHLDYVGGNEKPISRFAVISRQDNEAWRWKIVPASNDAVCIVSEHNQFDPAGNTHLTAITNYQKPGSDEVPVCLAPAGDPRGHWRIHKTDDDLLLIEHASPQYAGNFLGCLNMSPRIDDMSTGSQALLLNQIVLKRIARL
jgi:hypothetical protein